MHKTIILQPVGGLANRFCTLLSGMRLAQHFNAKLLLQWGIGSDCNARFEDLFYNPFEKNTLYRTHDCDYRKIIYADNPDRWTESPVIEAVPEDKPLWLFSHYILAHPEDNRHHSHYCLFDTIARETRDYFSYLQPVPAITQKLSRYDSVDFSKVFGLHIRRPYPSSSPDHDIESRRFNLPSDESYVEIAQKILNTGRFEKIFLATNDFTTQQSLVDSLGDKVFVHPKKSISNDSNTEAVQDGLVDMLLLSRCACVGRFVNSSFAYMGALLGLRPTLTISQHAPHAPITFGVTCFKPNGGFLEKYNIASFDDAMGNLLSLDSPLGIFCSHENQTA